jgi:uncharacterized protein YuzE
MMPTEYETRYDLESDMLIIKKKDAKIKRSVSIGNLTVDLDSNEQVIGIQQLNASKIVQFSEEVEYPEEFLQEVQDANIDTQYFEDGSLLLVATVNTEKEGEKIEASLNTQTPSVAA